MLSSYPATKIYFRSSPTGPAECDKNPPGQSRLKIDLFSGDGCCGRDVHVIFRVLSSLPDLKPTKTIVTRILATIPAARETPDRARGATAAQLSVKARMRVRIPPGPFFHLWRRFIRGENAEIISPSNLTLSPTPRNTEVDRELHHVLNDPGYPGSFSLSPSRQVRAQAERTRIQPGHIRMPAVGQQHDVPCITTIGSHRLPPNFVLI